MCVRDSCLEKVASDVRPAAGEEVGQKVYIQEVGRRREGPLTPGSPGVGWTSRQAEAGALSLVRS